MEATLINEVCKLMQEHLTPEQNHILKATLHNVFKHFNIPEHSEHLSPQSSQTKRRQSGRWWSPESGCSCSSLHRSVPRSLRHNQPAPAPS